MSNHGLLHHHHKHPKLPTLDDIHRAKTNTGTDLNLDNIQGDLLIGMMKHHERAFFFGIKDVTSFKVKLRNEILPRITSTRQLLDPTKLPKCIVNISFSQVGLHTLGVHDDVGDVLFKAGQEANAEALGDPGTAGWVRAFVGKAISGLFLLASDCEENVVEETANIKKILGDSIVHLHQVDGAVRPGDQKGHEHFGFLDGISQPAVQGFHADPKPGQIIVRPGVIIVGHTGDPIKNRPAWTKDGSFLSFRLLQQLVPEWNKYMDANPILQFGLTRKEGSALLAARTIGRWPSGTPVDLAPLRDDPTIGADPRRRNNFTYAHDGHDITSNQTACPFSAHTRKTNPRADLDPESLAKQQIFRSGIAYGPELTLEEIKAEKTIEDRGFIIVAYQSDITSGFFHQQKSANDPNFAPGKTTPEPHVAPLRPGFDGLLGANHGKERFVNGLDPTRPDGTHKFMTDFVVSLGGEYFFAPPIAAIKGLLSEPQGHGHEHGHGHGHGHGHKH